MIRWIVDWVGRLYQPYFRPRVDGLETIPTGPALYVGNHNGGSLTPDTWILCRAVYRRYGMDGMPFALGHQFVMNAPLIGNWLRSLGGIEAHPEAAARLLDAGYKVLVYPGGDVDAYRPSRNRHKVVFDGREGYIRLALRCGVPIVPVVTVGAHDIFYVIDDGRRFADWLGLSERWRVKVWPITVSIPWGLTLGPPPPFVPYPAKIHVRILPPIPFERTGPATADDDNYVAQCAQRVESTMQQAMDEMVAESRTLS